MKFFNTGGVCHPDKHYMLPSRQRFVDEGVSVNVERLIQRESYFVIHAPRQVGKTTAMRELAKALTASGKYVAAIVPMNAGKGLNDSLGATEAALLNAWRSEVTLTLPPDRQPPTWPDAPPGNRIGAALNAWAKASPLPLVLFLDDIDVLEDDVLASVFSQLCSGDILRPDGFPASLAIVGSCLERSVFNLFNNAVRFLTLRNFNLDEARDLLVQHTAETGQVFVDAAIALIHELTQGQPRLVNLLAKICVEEVATNAAQPIEAKHVKQAREILMQNRQVHFDTLFDKASEGRMRRMIETMLADDILANLQHGDLDYAIEVGVVRRERFRRLTIANPIYRDVISHATMVRA